MLIPKIQAKEACDWLRAAGFPQYAQLFKDCRFPIDVELAKRDHRFLDKDALDSLCRRLFTLNKCAEMRLDLPKDKDQSHEDFIEDHLCAISPRWTHDRRMRQWRRLDSSTEPLRLTDTSSSPQDDVSSVHSSGSTESEGRNGKSPREGAADRSADDPAASRSSSRCSSSNKTPSSISGPPSPGSGGGSSTVSLEACVMDKPPRKKGTSLLRKMDKLRLRGTTGLLSPPRNHLTGMVPGSVGGSRASSLPSSPHATSSGGSSNSHSESSSAVSTPSPVARVRSNCKRGEMGEGVTRDDNDHTSTPDYNGQINNNISHNSLLFHIPHGHKPGTFPTSLAHKHALLDQSSVNWRTGSFHGYRQRRGCRRGAAWLDASPDHRLSIYDNVPDERRLSESQSGGNNVSDVERMMGDEVSRLLGGEDVFSALDTVLERINDLQQLVSTWTESLSEDDRRRHSASSSTSSCCDDSPADGSSSAAASPCPSSSPTPEVQRSEEDDDEGESCEDDSETRSPRVKSGRQLRRSSEQSLPSLPAGPGVEKQSVSQLALLQKLALLKLTALMDKHSPSSKQGWSWSVPKATVRKAKAPAAKARPVFGVPLLVNVQRTGAPLPPGILKALVYLRTQCLDQVGLFRKSGSKSRTQRLRETLESDLDGVSYDGQSAFDVADLVKQYFRDLPEPVFTFKLCETFLHIYQYFPKDQQLPAAQAAILLLPDENREALRTLLFFLRDVVACVDDNRMTPTNVAVCLAPSLFHLNALKRDAGAKRSSHRKYSLGRPDQRDLSENLAATQGLANMIGEAERLFQIPEFWPSSSAATDQPIGEEELEQNLRKLQQNTPFLIKEARDKSRSWESCPAPENVELAVKKTWRGCPLWTWRVSVEVDAGREVLLRRLLERPWDDDARRGSVIQALGERAHVYRYLRLGPDAGLASCLPREHLLLRTWQPEATRDPLYVSSVSTQHPHVPPEGVRVHTHACLYLLEASAGKSRLTHLCRTDTRGRSPAWHRQVSGHRMVASLLAIKASVEGRRNETTV
ncbi:rho GTPase-activating protein 7 isoform X2 [Syngnathus typhle]|uniref:rho GTPase-activating protein 7 isoform X2 n=1 Tax=Syngnathus typhle TaxID=161592 RepID=UPI002A6B5114|nr:rho GTPase-activating protein 7 isoform X2 [Syngnathus typhle]